MSTKLLAHSFKMLYSIGIFFFVLFGFGYCCEVTHKFAFGLKMFTSPPGDA